MIERGESIQNQIEMCKNYAFSHFDITEKDIVLYEDEGYSGGNIDRPEFKRLFEDIKRKEYGAIICYRLDRISRNVLDFSNILEILNKHSTSFISITEHFDTTTLIGRAMVNIAAVFAQLERETIAERIRDNMRRLARTGRYLGSTPPTGFIAEKVDYLDSNGNKSKLNKLAPVLNELEYVKLLFDKYITLGNLSKVETWLMQNSYRNKNGKYTGVSELKRLLNNPVYVRADEAVYDYYDKLGCDIATGKEELSGSKGMFLYGRHDRNKDNNNPQNWVVILAEHEGIIDSGLWVNTQHLLRINGLKAPRAGTSKVGLLTSKIKCADCGATMVVIQNSIGTSHYYKCKTKMKSRKTLCDIKNINGKNADKEIIDYITALGKDESLLLDVILQQKGKSAVDENALNMETARIKKAMRETEKAIKNLTLRLRDNSNSIAAKYIIVDIESLDADLQALHVQISLLEQEREKVKNYKNEKESSI